MARVLLVEGNEFVRDVLRGEMAAAGHRVDCVGRLRPVRRCVDRS